MSLRTEIFEQPDVLERLLRTHKETVRDMAAAVQRAGVRSIFVAARGTSDNAALYGKYLWGAVNRLPVAMATPSLFTLSDKPPKLDGALVVGISQSGQSPDIVAVVEEGRRQGAPTLAITNDPDSPLATAAEGVFETHAGAELAVAATKTYTAQIAAIALLAAAATDDAEMRRALDGAPEAVREALGLEASLRAQVERLLETERCAVLGRGYNYATAYEWSLKLEEMAYLVAKPFSSADFRHGPMAVVEAGFPVLAIAPSGAVLDDLVELLTGLRTELRAELLVLSDAPRALELASTPVRLPQGVPEWLSPLVTIVPAQLFCYHLTRAKGLDTERPRRLAKVTRTV